MWVNQSNLYSPNQPESENSIHPRAYFKENTPNIYPESGFEARYERVLIIYDVKNACSFCFNLRYDITAYFRQVTCFFLSIFNDGVLAGKHIIPDTKHYCKNGSLFTYVVRFGSYVNQFQTQYIFT